VPIQVRIRLLFATKFDVASDGMSAGFPGSAICRFHEPWPAARHHRKSEARQAVPHLSGHPVVRVGLPESCTSKNGDTRAHKVKRAEAAHKLTQNFEPELKFFESGVGTFEKVSIAAVSHICNKATQSPNASGMQIAASAAECVVGDQILAIYVIPIVVQLVLPALLLVWVAVGRDRTRADCAAKLLLPGTYIAATRVAGLWLVAPHDAAMVFAVLWIAVAIVSIAKVRRAPWGPETFRGWIGLTGQSVLASLSIALLAYSLSARRPPGGEFVELSFPLSGGTYLVVAGGSRELVNPHLQTLANERFRDYRGQSYAIDIVKTNRFGMRAAGIAPRDPARYFIFGDAVYAPCSGTVLQVADGFPDMNPPEPDRKHVTGNYVLLNCGRLHGRAGNSGNTGEPHLHIHAQKPPAAGGFFASGDPLPMRFNGRYLVRNDSVIKEGL
jgi:hypothetical protein